MKNITLNSKDNTNNACILSSINTQNKFINDSAIKFNQNPREYDQPVKERLLTLSNQNYNYENLNTEFSTQKRNNRNNLRTNENTIFNTGLNLVSPKMLYNNYKSINDINIPYGKYKENYNSTVNDLKDKLENSINFQMPNKSKKTRKSPLGFKFYEIPHKNDKKPSNNYRINLLRESIERSIKYNKPSTINKENLDELIGEENIRLKIFKNNLDAFTEINSLKHPNLNQITKMTKLKEWSLRISNSRHMGPKYDPHNYPK